MISKEQVFEALKNVFDPEIPINVVDMGLIYEIEVQEETVSIKMTLTAPGCPMHTVIAQDVKDQVKEKTGAKEVNVQMVWEPRWTPDRMSQDARKTLGI